MYTQISPVFISTNIGLVIWRQLSIQCPIECSLCRFGVGFPDRTADANMKYLKKLTGLRIDGNKLTDEYKQRLNATSQVQ